MAEPIELADAAVNALSFALSQEELYVLLAYLKLPAPPELENFAETVLLPLAGAQSAALQAVERGLVARQYLLFQAQGALSVHPGIAQALAACAQPNSTLLVMSRAPKSAQQTIYLHQHEELHVSHSLPAAGLHEVTVFADAQAAELSIAQLVGTLSPQASATATVSIQLAVAAYEAATRAAEQNQMEEAQRLLLDAGLSKTEAAIFSASLSNYQRVMVLAQIAYSPNSAPQPTDGMTVINSPSGVWVLGAGDDSAQVCIQRVNLESLASRLHQFFF